LAQALGLDQSEVKPPERESSLDERGSPPIQGWEEVTRLIE